MCHAEHADVTVADVTVKAGSSQQVGGEEASETTALQVPQVCLQKLAQLCNLVLRHLQIHDRKQQLFDVSWPLQPAWLPEALHRAATCCHAYLSVSPCLAAGAST
jgi:hypothetical protein